MPVPPGWYADITLNTSWTLTRGGSSSQAIMLSLLCWVPLGPRLSAAIGEGSPPSRKTPADRFPPPNALCAPDKPAKPMLSKLASRKALASQAALRSGKSTELRRPLKALARGRDASDSIQHDCAPVRAGGPAIWRRANTSVAAQNLRQTKNSYKNELQHR